MKYKEYNLREENKILYLESSKKHYEFKISDISCFAFYIYPDIEEKYSIYPILCGKMIIPVKNYISVKKIYVGDMYIKFKAEEKIIKERKNIKTIITKYNYVKIKNIYNLKEIKNIIKKNKYGPIREEFLVKKEEKYKNDELISSFKKVINLKYK